MHLLTGVIWKWSFYMEWKNTIILHVLSWINIHQGFNHWHFNCVGVLKALKTVLKTSALHKEWKSLRVAGCLWSLRMAPFQKLANGRALTHLEAMRQNTTFSQPDYKVMLPWWSGQVEKTDSDFGCCEYISQTCSFSYLIRLLCSFCVSMHSRNEIQGLSRLFIIHND